MPLTFYEKYHQTDCWYEKCIIIAIYHNVRVGKNKEWMLLDTAKDFKVSVGLVSENLRIAAAMDKDPQVINCGSREKALKYLGILKE